MASPIQARLQTRLQGGTFGPIRVFDNTGLSGKPPAAEEENQTHLRLDFFRTAPVRFSRHGRNLRTASVPWRSRPSLRNLGSESLPKVVSPFRNLLRETSQPCLLNLMLHPGCSSEVRQLISTAGCFRSPAWSHTAGSSRTPGLPPRCPNAARGAGARASVFEMDTAGHCHCWTPCRSHRPGAEGGGSHVARSHSTLIPPAGVTAPSPRGNSPQLFPPRAMTLTCTLTSSLLRPLTSRSSGFQAPQVRPLATVFMAC